MKITITGALGNIGKPLARLLAGNGNQLTIISSDPEKSTAIEAIGANAAIGSVSDIAFLVSAFKGADAVYTMVPPNWNVPDYRRYIAETGENYRAAIEASGVPRVVNLSSIGAHLPAGTGAIAGLHDVEQTLNTLDNVAIKHLRPGLFFVNFFFDIPTIRNFGCLGNNYGPETGLAMVHPEDIAKVAAQELQAPLQGKSHRYVVGDILSASGIAKILGSAIGRPELPWVKFGDEEMKAGMIAAGMSPAIAALYVEMGHAIAGGVLFEDFDRQQPKALETMKLTGFAGEFAAAYNAQQ